MSRLNKKVEELSTRLMERTEQLSEAHQAKAEVSKQRVYTCTSKYGIYPSSIHVHVHVFCLLFLLQEVINIICIIIIIIEHPIICFVMYWSMKLVKYYSINSRIFMCVCVCVSVYTVYVSLCV